ncbi:hypothetical protein LSAT2_008233, partial [Lamellibrachia satsuma]
MFSLQQLSVLHERERGLRAVVRVLPRGESLTTANNARDSAALCCRRRRRQTKPTDRGMTRVVPRPCR